MSRLDALEPIRVVPEGDRTRFEAGTGRTFSADHAVTTLTLQNQMPSCLRCALDRDSWTVFVAAEIPRSGLRTDPGSEDWACAQVRRALAALESGILPPATVESPANSRDGGDPTPPFSASFGPPAHLVAASADLGLSVEERESGWTLTCPGKPPIAIDPGTPGDLRLSLDLSRDVDLTGASQAAQATFLLAANASLREARCALAPATGARVEVFLPPIPTGRHLERSIRSLHRAYAAVWRETRALECEALAMLYLAAVPVRQGGPIEPDRAI